MRGDFAGMAQGKARRVSTEASEGVDPRGKRWRMRHWLRRGGRAGIGRGEIKNARTGASAGGGEVAGAEDGAEAGYGFEKLEGGARGGRRARSAARLFRARLQRGPRLINQAACHGHDQTPGQRFCRAKQAQGLDTHGRRNALGQAALGAACKTCKAGDKRGDLRPCAGDAGVEGRGGHWRRA